MARTVKFLQLSTVELQILMNDRLNCTFALDSFVLDL